MGKFLMATGLPVLTLVAASLWGGIWAVLALIATTGFSFAMDRMTRDIPPPLPGLSGAAALTLALAIAHFGLLALAILSLSQGWPGGAAHLVPVYAAYGIFFGQISNSVGHELIHSGTRWKRRLGQWIYISLLFGHHTSAHPLVHHVHVATDKDPNSARKGENYYGYCLRAWTGAFTAGFQAETARRKRRGKGGLHPYSIYVGGAVGLLGLVYVIAGMPGMIWYLALCLYAHAQLLLSDYVQHYGLRRRIDASGKPEPVGPQHSWNAPHWYTAAMMLNAPRHSDHHLRPGVPYEELELHKDTMPMMPHSLPTMAVIALFPPLWRRVMDKRVARWHARQSADTA